MVNEADFFNSEDFKGKETVYADYNTTKKAIFEYFEGYHQSFRDMITYTEIGMGIPDVVYTGLVSYAKGFYFLIKRNFNIKNYDKAPKLEEVNRLNLLLSKPRVKKYTEEDFYFIEEFFTCFMTDFGLFNLSVNKGAAFL
jgi:hypothetical protein